MKKIISTYVALLFTILCSAQLNNLNNTELFEGIKFSDVTLGEIMESKGDLNKINSIFKNNLVEEADDSAPFKGKYIYDHNISFGFEDTTNTGNDFYLTSVRIKNESIIVSLNKLQIKLGDSKNKFDGYEFNKNFGGYVFTDQDTGSVSLAFKIDDTTKTVSEIKFSNF